MISRTLVPGTELDELAARAAAVTGAVSRQRGLGDALAWRAQELKVATTNDVPDVVRRWVLMSDGDRDVAAVELEASLVTDGPPDCDIWVHPDADVAAVLTAGVGLGQQFARELGRETVLIWALHEEQDEQLASPAGAGAIGGDAIAEWLLGAAARLAQVYRISAIDRAR